MHQLESKKMIENPKILTLNLSVKANDELKDKGFNVYAGSLGKLTDTKNQKGEFKYHLTQQDFPPNSHEFDVLIVDFSNEEVIEYVKSENERDWNKDGNNTFLLCKYPQTIFDPRALSSHLFVSKMREILQKECMIIIFQNEVIDITYELAEENGTSPRIKGHHKASLYELVPYNYFNMNKFGRETKVISNNTELSNFLGKFNKDFTYENTFKYPTVWNDNDEKVPDPNFHPLILNKSDEVVSYCYLHPKNAVFIFPVLEDNSEFIVGFLETIAPSIMPSLFPYSTEGSWTEDIEYALPNYGRLIEEKEKIISDFEESVKIKDEEIKLNNNKYSFLHKILTETGENLVSAVIEFLNWLGFENIVDMDGLSEKNKEEDIQIETTKGLLVIEVKGIGGTSKDAECSQISKIKYRRAKERGEFDVFGLYIVNHQRHIPALQRENPPFTKEQIEDSINDERGLLTTWSLYNLYFDIQDEILSKEEGRELLFAYGLISFIPQNLQFIDTIKEVFMKGQVFILNLDGVKIKTGDTLYVEKNGKFQKVTILEIKRDEEVVKEISSGEIGIKGNIIASKNMKVYIRNIS